MAEIAPSPDAVPDVRAPLAPIGLARGLPNRTYTHAAALAAERDRVFGRTWTCIGFAKDVARPGDARPVSLVDVPLLMLRDQKGALRVFHNVCSHRGMILVTEPTRLKGPIRCPYHSWSYRQDGTLVATPHVGGPGCNVHDAIRREALGLKPVRTAVWFDLVFVDLSGDAPPFADWIAPLADRWRAFDLDRLVHAGPDSSLRLEVQCNWKLAVENYCEAYHLPWIHPSLNTYSKLDDHYAIVEGGRFSGQGTTVYNPPLQGGRHFPEFPDLPEVWRSRGEYVALYPNVLLGLHRDHAFAIRLEPTAAGHTVEHIEIYYTDPEAAADDFAAQRRALTDTWEIVFREDVFVVEGMQRGRSSPAFAGGVFSPAMEAPTHAFHQWVASRLSAA